MLLTGYSSRVHPVGPKRSVRTRDGACPSSTSSVATDSTSTRRATHICVRRRRGWPAHGLEHRAVDAAAKASPVGGAPRVKVNTTSTSGRVCELLELGAVKHVVRRARGVEQTHRTAARAPVSARSRWRNIAISGTIPEPPATSSSGPPRQRPTRSIHRSARVSRARRRRRSSSTRYGDTSPSSSRSTVSATVRSSGG